MCSKHENNDGCKNTQPNAPRRLTFLLRVKRLLAQKTETVLVVQIVRVAELFKRDESRDSFGKTQRLSFDT